MQSAQLKRREFITLLGGAAVAWPLAARAQEPNRTYRIGFLIRAPRNTPFADAAFDELRVNGFIDGQNLIVLPGGFDDPNEVIAERAAALVKAGPDVILRVQMAPSAHCRLQRKQCRSLA
jgi:putative tryptophan/tyrosine transport system substrate-binding protein